MGIKEGEMYVVPHLLPPLLLHLLDLDLLLVGLLPVAKLLLADPLEDSSLDLDLFQSRV